MKEGMESASILRMEGAIKSFSPSSISLPNLVRLHPLRYRETTSAELAFDLVTGYLSFLYTLPKSGLHSKTPRANLWMHLVCLSLPDLIEIETELQKNFYNGERFSDQYAYSMLEFQKANKFRSISTMPINKKTLQKFHAAAWK